MCDSSAVPGLRHARVIVATCPCSAILCCAWVLRFSLCAACPATLEVGHGRTPPCLRVQVKEYNDKGQLVPDEIVNNMVKERLSKPDCARGWILVRGATLHGSFGTGETFAQGPRRQIAPQFRFSDDSLTQGRPRSRLPPVPPPACPRCLQDGYPRTVQQAKDLDGFKVR